MVLAAPSYFPIQRPHRVCTPLKTVKLGDRVRTLFGRHNVKNYGDCLKVDKIFEVLTLTGQCAYPDVVNYRLWAWYRLDSSGQCAYPDVVNSYPLITIIATSSGQCAYPDVVNLIGLMSA